MPIFLNGTQVLASALPPILCLPASKSFLESEGDWSRKENALRYGEQQPELSKENRAAPSMRPWLSWMFLVSLQTAADTNDSAAGENSVQLDKSAGRLPPINQEAFKMEAYEICIKYKKRERLNAMKFST